MLKHSRAACIESIWLLVNKHLFNLKLVLMNLMKDLIGMHLLLFLHMTHPQYFLHLTEFGNQKIEEIAGILYQEILLGTKIELNFP